MIVTSEDAKITKISVWAPVTSMIADPFKGSNLTYHPLVLEMKNKRPNGTKSWLLIGYNNNHGTGDINRDWTSLPTIDFLPEDKKLNRRIIAGSGGLLVIDVGHEECYQKSHQGKVAQTPNENFWKHPDIFMNFQSIVFVANPLTKEYIFLPPLPGRLMNKKIGKFIWRNNERTSYILILIGWNAEVEIRSEFGKNDRLTKMKKLKNDKILVESIGLFVYCSKEQCYIYCDEIKGRLGPYYSVGSSSIAILDYRIFVGGMNIIKNAKALEARIPCIYYFNISNSAGIKKLVLPFCFKGIPQSIILQAPRIVQGGLTRVFAVTCAAIAAITLYIVEIVFNEQKNVFLEFKLVATMPNNFFHKLFLKSPCNDYYEVSGCNNLISFKVGGKGISIVQYHTENSQWSSTNFPRHRPSNVACYHLADASYEPCFNARP
ncbi:hypothetical protein KC19_VG258000 [Ceratodon purpureus]|uniref:Uncharacterized protein n=1 Tax=Ceratodon purpureus TaxID=3225 RepID=A0A8T0HTK0_CERPU|nr:hypothetical protein KC19_VG258000 [Ceratodon purpureus]